MTPTELAQLVCKELSQDIHYTLDPGRLDEVTLFDAEIFMTYPHDIFHVKAAMVFKDRTGKEYVIYVRNK